MKFIVSIFVQKKTQAECLTSDTCTKENLEKSIFLPFLKRLNYIQKKVKICNIPAHQLSLSARNQQNTLVFFSSAQYGWEDVFYFIKYYSDFDLHFAEIKAPKLRNQLHTKLKKNHYIFDKDVPYCLSYCEAFKKPDAPSEIYKAIESVLSFLKFKIESRKLRADKTGVYTQFYYPIVVLDGSLFEAEIDEDAIQVKKRDHIHLRVDFEDEIFMLDIVTKQKFEDFFNTIENDHYDFVECINKINFSQEYISSLKKYKGET